MATSYAVHSSESPAIAANGLTEMSTFDARV